MRMPRRWPASSLAAGGSGGGVVLSVESPIEVVAHASDRGAGNAVASAVGGFRASGADGATLNLGPLTDEASAENWGNGSAKALASVAAVDASIPPGPIGIAGNVVLLAHAHNFSGAPQGSGAIGASANAELDFGGGG